MNRHFNPDDMIAPMAVYSHGVEVPAGARTVYVAGQVAFHFKDDTTFRLVPTDVPTADLRTTHFAYDLTDSRRDPNVVFPIDPLRDLVASGEVGELAPQAITFMGGIYSSRRVRDELAPAITDNLRRQEVDVVLLVPV